MEIATCRNCGKIFNHIRGQMLCPTCMKAMDEKFKEVKNYVYDHPSVGIHQLSKEMDVPTSQINRWIREERLTFTEDSAIVITCEKCGANILTGRLCEKCKKELVGGLSNAAGLNKRQLEPEKKENRSTTNRMRFLDQ